MDCEIGSQPSSHFDAPGHALDYVTGAVVLVFMIPFVIGNLVMVWFRDYPPIRSKCVILTVMGSFGGFTWIVASFVMFDSFTRKRKNTILGMCALWMSWLRVTFGVALWLACFILRLLNVRLILIMKRGAIKYVKVALGVLLIPSIIYSVLDSSCRGDRFVVDNKLNQSTIIEPRSIGHHPEGQCTAAIGWVITHVSVILAYFAVFIWLAVGLRNVRPPYNEFRLIHNGGFFILFLFSASLVNAHTMTNRDAVGRCFLILIQSGAVMYYFWARNSEAIYNVLFNKEQYLVDFLDQMNSVALTGQSDNPNPLQSLFSDVRDEVASAQAEVQELEHTLAKLQEQYKQEWVWRNVSRRWEWN